MADRALATRQRLLTTALALLRAEGAAGVTTGRVAAGAGLSQSGFYRYFADLDACIDAAVRADERA